MSSVQMRIHMSPRRKAWMTPSRCALGRSLWITSTCKPSYTSSWNSSRARWIDWTNRSTGGFMPPDWIRARSAWSLPSSEPANSSRCSMVSVALSFCPTSTRHSSTINVCASVSTPAGSVALNSALRRFGFVHAARMVSVCVRNPCSSRRSASSSTSVSTSPSGNSSCSIACTSRRGVVMRMSYLELLSRAASFAAGFARVSRQVRNGCPRASSCSCS